MRIEEKFLTIDEYLDRDFEPETELIAGELRPKPLGTKLHSRMCLKLCLLLVRLTGIERTHPELSIRIGDDVLIPDVCVLRVKEEVLYRDILAEPPLLCIEVVSPSQRPAEMIAKCERYHEFGVPFCWVIDPVKRRAWETHAGKPATEQTELLTAGEILLELSALFSD